MLRHMLRNWLLSAPRNAEVASSGGMNPLHLVGTMDNPTTLMVTPIDNGFLLINRQYNSSGPDSIGAMFAPDAESLANAVINRLAQARLKI